MSKCMPPPVCSGTGTIAVDLQGITVMPGLPKHGDCGICGQRVRVDGFFRCVTHPYPSRCAGEYHGETTIEYNRRVSAERDAKRKAQP